MEKSFLIIWQTAYDEVEISMTWLLIAWVLSHVVMAHFCHCVCFCLSLCLSASLYHWSASLPAVWLHHHFTQPCIVADVEMMSRSLLRWAIFLRCKLTGDVCMCRCLNSNSLIVLNVWSRFTEAPVVLLNYVSFSSYSFDIQYLVMS